MGFYSEKILPRGIDWALSGKEFQELRREFLADVKGRVVELGFGSGLNLPHYSPGVEEVWAVEPSSTGRKLAQKRIVASSIPVRFVGLVGEKIDLENECADAVVSTWTLCTIENLPQALSEVRRVLKPGGTFYFLEHGRSRDPGIARWQDRLNPLQKKISGGCNLNRAMDACLRESGFRFLHLEEFYWLKGWKTHSYFYRGAAVSSSA